MFKRNLDLIKQVVSQSLDTGVVHHTTLLRPSYLNAMEVVDVYKFGHRVMYPDGTEQVFSNWTARSDKYLPKIAEYWDGRHPILGTQAFIREFMINLFDWTFFGVPKKIAVDGLIEKIELVVPGKCEREWVENLHDLGYLPLRIRALPEGTMVPSRIAEVLFDATKDGYAYLVNYVETLWSNGNWHAATVGAIAIQYRRLLEKWAEITGVPMDFIQWQGHDFSYRGHGNPYDAFAMIGHAYAFSGSDTFPVHSALAAYYQMEGKPTIGSVYASEHSVACMYGKGDEREYVRKIITDKVPTGICSLVGDTWDIKDFVDMVISLKEEVLARPVNQFGQSKVVVRPDSGNPADIICGFPYLAINHPDWTIGQCITATRDAGYYHFIDVATGQGYRVDEAVGGVQYATQMDKREIWGVVEQLWNGFGGTVTAKGYKMLHERVGTIYGDSITLEIAENMMSRLSAKGFASCNVVLGIGSFTYRYVTRDSLGYAIKATGGVVNGQFRELFKDPVTDNGVKKSAKGLISVSIDADGNYVQKDCATMEEYESSVHQLVFKDSVAYNEVDWPTVCNRRNA